MMPCSSRVASPGERASSNAFHHRALTSAWWRSGSLPVTFLSAWTVQRCSRASGLSSRVAFQIQGAPSASTSAGERSPRSIMSRANASQGVVALAAPQSQSEQDLPALQGYSPADQDSLRWCVVGAQLQIDRIQKQVDDVVGLEALAAPLPVSLAGVLTDPRDRALRGDRLLEDILQRRLDIPRREAPQEAADHQRLQAWVRATPLPRIRLSNPSLPASRILGRSRRIAPLVVFTVLSS
jgi:hypothetical protein